MSVQDENCDDEENETASNSIDEMLSSVLQSKSALQHVFKISRPRKNLPENTDEILYSAKQNGSVTRSNSLMPKFTPECNSLKNSSSHSKYLANANNYVNQRQHDKISVRSTSKIVRSTSTPEINSKFIIPVSSSITKTNTHRRIDFSSDKHEKENNYYPEKRGNMPTMNEYVHLGTSSKLHSNTNCSNGSDDLSRSNSFSGLFRSRSLSRTPYNINGSNYIKNELKPHEAKHSTDELAVRRLECNRAVTTPSDKYSSCYGEKIYGNSSILLLQEKETKTPRTYFPKVVPASQVAKKSNVPAELINSAFKTPSSTVRSSRTKEPCQPSPSPSLALKDSDVITVNNLAYLILRELGKGGSSVVYEVFDLQNRPRKAIKIVKLEQEDEAIRNSYKNEIQILRRLQYSNRIIKLFDYEETPTHLKIVMEAGDVDLARILSEARQKKNAPISPFSIKHYWQGMLLAVQVIHNEGIIHSDLKPSNFLLVNGTLKLIDFGIASSVQQDMTSVFKDMPTGTYNYMSPESLNDIYSGPVINRKDLDKPTFKINMKSDVWSLGCILYNLVYGKTPFQHLKPLQKLVAISNPATTISFPPLSDKNLLDVMQKCLQFDAYKRPSIKELLNHPYLEGAVTPEVSPKKLLVSQCKEAEVQSFPSEKK